jgi:hypothetical protein
MVLTEDVLSKEPWGETYWESHQGYNFGWAGQRATHFEFQAQFKLVQDTPQGFWKRGDIILFGSGYWNWHKQYEWKKWFMTQEDYLNNLHNDESISRDKRIPMYARSEYGMMISRYKWIKDKGYKVFYDYGSIIMMLTGSKAGHIRRYYIKTPYNFLTSYPYDHIMPYYVKQGITKIPEVGRIQEAMNYSDTKDQFILNMIESFNNPNYAKEKECEYQSHTDLEKKTDTINLPFQKTFS